HGGEAGEEDDGGQHEECEVGADVRPLAAGDDRGHWGMADWGADGNVVVDQIAEDDLCALRGEAEKGVDGIVDCFEKRAVLDDDRAEGELENDAPRQGAQGNPGAMSA